MIFFAGHFRKILICKDYGYQVAFLVERSNTQNGEPCFLQTLFCLFYINVFSSDICGYSAMDHFSNVCCRILCFLFLCSLFRRNIVWRYAFGELDRTVSDIFCIEGLDLDRPDRLGRHRDSDLDSLASCLYLHCFCFFLLRNGYGLFLRCRGAFLLCCLYGRFYSLFSDSRKRFSCFNGHCFLFLFGRYSFGCQRIDIGSSFHTQRVHDLGDLIVKFGDQLYPLFICDTK